MSKWSTQLPTEPGTYLFYGDTCQPSPHPRWLMLEALQLKDGTLSYTTDGEFVYDTSQWYGVFRKWEETPPDLKDFDLRHQKGWKQG